MVSNIYVPRTARLKYTCVVVKEDDIKRASDIMTDVCDAYFDEMSTNNEFMFGGSRMVVNADDMFGITDDCMLFIWDEIVDNALKVLNDTDIEFDFMSFGMVDDKEFEIQ